MCDCVGRGAAAEAQGDARSLTTYWLLEGVPIEQWFGGNLDEHSVRWSLGSAAMSGFRLASQCSSRTMSLMAQKTVVSFIDDLDGESEADPEDEVASAERKPRPGNLRGARPAWPRTSPM